MRQRGPAIQSLWRSGFSWRSCGFSVPALIGLGVVLLWCQSHLTNPQRSSLVKVLSVVLGALALMTVVQQIAIRSANAGWVLSGTLLLTATACAVSTVGDAKGHAV